jgi:hypothetical protein
LESRFRHLGFEALYNVFKFSSSPKVREYADKFLIRFDHYLTLKENMKKIIKESIFDNNDVLVQKLKSKLEVLDDFFVVIETFAFLLFLNLLENSKLSFEKALNFERSIKESWVQSWLPLKEFHDLFLLEGKKLLRLYAVQSWVELKDFGELLLSPLCFQGVESDSQCLGYAPLYESESDYSDFHLYHKIQHTMQKNLFYALDQVFPVRKVPFKSFLKGFLFDVTQKYRPSLFLDDPLCGFREIDLADQITVGQIQGKGKRWSLECGETNIRVRMKKKFSKLENYCTFFQEDNYQTLIQNLVYDLSAQLETKMETISFIGKKKGSSPSKWIRKYSLALKQFLKNFELLSEIKSEGIETKLYFNEVRSFYNALLLWKSQREE